MRIPNVWTLSGTVGRRSYLATGVVLMGVKYTLDELVAWYGFHREWPVTNYVSLGSIFQIDGTPASARSFYVTMISLAIPFLWIGLAMTMRRLRSAGLPPYLALLFMIRPLNLLLIGLLVVLPARGTPEYVPESARSRFLGAVIPRSNVGRAVFAVSVTVLTALGLTWLSVQLLGDYSWGLFFFLPVLIGFLPAWIESAYYERARRSIGLSILSMVFYGFAMLLFAGEGLICLLMAAPLGIGLAAIGGAIGVSARRSRRVSSQSSPMACFAILAVPLVMLTEHALPTRPPLLSVRSEVVVNAPAERVWRNVVGFPKLTAPREVMFQAGIAYPISAQIYGRGEGAVRHCNFSTGTFVEPITVWQEPRLLRFRVTAQPEPMHELSPYDIHPRHLHGYLRCEQGEFRLVPLPGGRTELVGTTWYRNYFWPQAYWQLWTQPIIHAIHLRVLRHIKTLSEAPAQ